jgi:F0F1-type ATP synthase epsilon subunit
MNDERTLMISIRTPNSSVFEGEGVSLRVPTQTGQVGLRPRSEPNVLAVEPGLVVLKTQDATRYAGTAGGLLHIDGQSAVLLTPIAVVGDDIQSVSDQLDALMAVPSEEMEVRRNLNRLETRMMQELRQAEGAGRTTT